MPAVNDPMFVTLFDPGKISDPTNFNGVLTPLEVVWNIIVSLN